VQFAPGSPEYLGLELYLARRAEGVAIEAPAIRK
jgi:sulfur-oxidizing protein SoxA